MSTKEYVFYLYHRVKLDKKNIDECFICEKNGSKNHEHLGNDDYWNVNFYLKEKFTAKLKPQTFKEYKFNINILANYCIWDEWDESYPTLDNDESVEDECDQKFIVINKEKKEVDGYEYLESIDIHYNLEEGGSTQFEVWAEDYD